MCPPANVAHDISEYSDYYDPIYYPDLHRNILISPNSVSSWLEIALSHHIVSCPSCSCWLGGSQASCSVRHEDGSGTELCSLLGDLPSWLHEGQPGY